MSVSVERLRVGLVVGAGLLVLIVGAFLGYAHYRAHRFLTGLPGKLGIDVRQETNGYTYSQTVGSKTIYTVHAAKSVQHRDGKYTLKDVGIVVYGKNQDRADRIYGSEFELDQAAGVIRAMGEVFIDLQAPEAQDANGKMDFAAGKDLRGAGAVDAGRGAQKTSGSARLIHIRTSGLVYLQKLGVAATDKEIEFTSGGMVGHAVGADYNSDTGLLILHSSVKVTGMEHDRPVVLTASEAKLDRQNQTAVLSQARYRAVGGRSGASGDGETAQARHVVVSLRKDGSAERLQADGDVILANGQGGKVMAPQGEMRLDQENHPQTAMLAGGLKYGEDGPLRQAQGEAAEGRAIFDRAGRVEHVEMTGAVHLKERVRVSGAKGDLWSERELGGNTVDLAMVTDGGRTELRDAKATGAARVKVVSPGGGAAGPRGSGISTSSALAGDVLTAHFVTVNGASRLSEMQGAGHTVLRRVGPTGVVNTSSGDSLVARFRPIADGDSHGRPGADEIASAVEQGHVVMTQVPVRKPGDSNAPEEERATADKAVYDGGLERMILTGEVQVSDGTSVLWADRVVTEQGSGNGLGDATADGSVKASYREAGGSDEPVHVLAVRAELKRGKQKAIFYGGPGRPARLWQGGSQVEAPVLEFEQKQGRLLAHGEGQGAGLVVHTVLVGTGAGGGAGTGGGRTGYGVKAVDGGRQGKAADLTGGSSGKTEVVRVASGALMYSDEARQAEFTGGVQVESADGMMRGQQAVVYMQSAAAGGRAAQGVAAQTAEGGKTGLGKTNLGKTDPAQGGGLMGGGVERIVATGDITMEQPGRRATGEQVVYTAGDGMFVLTGTAAVLPKVVDQRQGTVTGASLRFHSGDDDVVVSNGGGKGQRVRTETRVKNRE